MSRPNGIEYSGTLKIERQYPILRSAEILLCPVYFNSAPMAPKSSAASLYSASGEINLKKEREEDKKYENSRPCPYMEAKIHCHTLIGCSTTWWVSLM